MTLIEAAKLTLEALESIPEDVEGYLPESCTDAVIALRTAIEAAEKQEPVAWPCEIEEADFGRNTVTVKMLTPNYAIRAGKHWLSTTPPAAQQEPVTQCMEHGECFGGECIYTTPPAAQRQWVGLEREIAIAVLNHCYGHIVISADMIDRTTEVIKAKLKERSHG